MIPNNKRDSNMLLENLKYYKEKSNKTFEQISCESKTPLSTIKNIFSGKHEPLASTLHRIATTLNTTLDALLADTNVVIVPKSLIEERENVETVEAERDLVSIENEKLKIEIDALKNDLTTRETRIKLLELELQHKEELIKLHDFYNKIFSRE